MGETTYYTRVLFAMLMTVAGFIFVPITFIRLAAKPSIGVKKKGKAMSDERIARDWIEIGA